MAKPVADVAAHGGQSEIQGPNRPRGLRFERYFTPPGSHAYDLVEWERRTAAITSEKGAVIFEQRDVEVPRTWSQLATNVVAQKYFRGHLGSPDREHSARQLIDRVVTTIGRWGREGGYFATEDDAANWEEDLRWLLVTQHASFNSPVWFNIGVPGRAQQASACFINSVEDTMESILELAKTEGMLFKFGSGTGTNLSVLRSSKESLAGGGTASGPVSFMRGYDSFAGSIKSGGTTRRAAKMVILNADHPDILDFITCKAEEEKKAWALIEAGYDPGFNVLGGAYDSVQFQNANHSVRVSDEFMQAVERDGEWQVRAVTDRRPLATHRARDIWRAMADAAWICGDPGVQFDTTIQSWNCVPNTGRINATNPCFTGDALVHTNKGLVPFKELFERVNRGELFKVYTHDQTNPDAPSDTIALTTPKAFMVTGYHEVVRLRFSNGMEVRCTPNHRFFTRNRGYVRADELTDDDRVLTLDHRAASVDASYELPISGDAADYRSKGDHTSLPVELPARWTPEFAHYLGWLVGDGFVSDRLEVAGTVYGTVEDQEIVLPGHRELVAQMHGGFESRLSVQASGTQQLRIGRKAFARFFAALGLSTGRAATKVVPWSIKQAPPDIVASFLQGLFDADGCVRDGGDKGRYVGLGSRSEALVQDVQRLLTSFGISSRLYLQERAQPSFRYVRRNGDEVAYGSDGPAYDLRITGRSLRRFADEIGFSLHSKAERMARLLTKEQYRTDTATKLVARMSDGVELTYNLTEPRNHSYVVNGLVVANCSEFVFLDDTACNLLSLNLLKYQDADGRFDVERFQRAVDVCFTAQEILVSNASYPTTAIAQNSERLRPLGLGYANLGALLMSMGLAYDSDDGRRYAGAITAIMTGRAYAHSARMAQVKGPFAEFEANREPMLRVMAKHRAAAYELQSGGESAEVVNAARTAWDEALALGERLGYRNAQASVLAPTGTIGLQMDCDTTGIEPDLALVKYKKLVGGGLLKIVNGTVPEALRKLGYSEDQVKEIVEYIDEHDTIEGAPDLEDQHLKVFDCAFKPVKGVRSIAPMGHVRMMAAVQPFISGSQSKTVNLPTEATVEDIASTYLESWKLGLKCIAIYRDGCKRSQPLSTSRSDATAKAKDAEPEPPAQPMPVRRRLPDERHSLTHKFDIQGHEGYVTVGLYDDGTPGEIFLKVAKEGSTISGLMDAFALQTSMALQYGVPLRMMVNKFSHVRFEPSGFTKNPEIPIAKSIIDYIFRWLASRFLDSDDQEAVGILRRDPNLTSQSRPASSTPPVEPEPPTAQLTRSEPRPANRAQNGANGTTYPSQKLTFVVNADSPACADCGSITVRSGACYKCMNCGSTTGCS
jgi:ribonucleoside-diphosphate reductase alpha chain